MASWKNIYPRAVRAEKDFAMLEAGDRVLLGISGGADSLALLDVLMYQRARIGKKLGLEVIPAHVPGNYRGRPVANVERLRMVCRDYGAELRLSSSTLSEGVFGDCFRCSQARRKALFDLAEAGGCNKIALGHNADDLVETFLLNAFYSGRLAAISPRQPVLRGKLALIRPLSYVWKSDIERFARERFGRLARFDCPGARDSRRLSVRRLLERWTKANANLKPNLLRALFNLRLEYLPCSGVRSGVSRGRDLENAPLSVDLPELI